MGRGVAVDASGNVYTTGIFFETADFDVANVTAGDTLTSAGDADVFVSRHDSAGNLVWVRQMGGAGFDQAGEVVLDDIGNVYTAGSFMGTADYDPGAGTHILTSSGGSDIIVSRLDNAGDFVSALQMGGLDDDAAVSMAVDGSGNVYTTGRFGGTADFDPGAGTANLTSDGERDVFISKLGPSDSDGDGVLDADDVCDDTVIPEGVPTVWLITNQWALVDDDLNFDTVAPKGVGPVQAFTTTDTAGCSCEQIIAGLGLGSGHTRFGCSISAMEDWVALVTP